jgi:hypothetical protein
MVTGAARSRRNGKSVGSAIRISTFVPMLATRISVKPRTQGKKSSSKT